LIFLKKNIYSIFGFNIILESDFVFAVGQNIYFIIRLASTIYYFEIIVREYFGLIYLLRNQFFFVIKYSRVL
jgi:hypothetical protein